MLSTGELVSIIAAIIVSVGGGVFAFFKWGFGGFKETVENLAAKVDALVSDEELEHALKKVDERFKGLGKTVGALSDENRAIERDVAAFKLDVAKHYVTKGDLTTLQQRLERMIDDLGKHVDTKIDELRKWLMDLIAARGKNDG